MKRPTSEQIKQARGRVQSKGRMSDDTVWTTLLAIRDPECADCCKRMADGAFEMLGLEEEQRLLLQGIINGAFIAGLHIALEVEQEQ